MSLASAPRRILISNIRTLTAIRKPIVTRTFQTYTTKMSDIQTVLPQGFKVAGPYSPAVKAGGTIYVSGQIPAVPTTGELVEGSITDKTTQICENIKAILAEAGSSIDRVVKVGVFLDDMAHFKEMNGTYEKYFAHKPARSCVAVKQLPLGVSVEIECIALACKDSRL